MAAEFPCNFGDGTYIPGPMKVVDNRCADCRRGHYEVPGGVTNFPCTTEGCGCWFCGPVATPEQARARGLDDEAIADWVKNTCLLFGTTTGTAYQVAGLFVAGLAVTASGQSGHESDDNGRSGDPS